MSNIDKKIFSVGFTPDCTHEDIDEFFDKYHQVLQSVYCSPPISAVGTEITSVDMFNNFTGDAKYLDRFNHFIKRSKEYKVDFDLVVNGNKLTNAQFDEIHRWIDILEPSEITTMESYVDQFRKLIATNGYNIDLVRSHNNGPLRHSEVVLGKFDRYIFAKRELWDPTSWTDDLSKTRLLVNNCCIWSCPGCYREGNSKTTKQIFKDEVVKFGFEKVMARSSILPEDLHLIHSYFPEIQYKLNTRTHPMKITLQLMKDFVNGTKTVSLMNRVGANSNTANLASMHKHGQFNEYISNAPIDVFKLLSAKKEMQDLFKDKAALRLDNTK